MASENCRLNLNTLKYIVLCHVDTEMLPAARQEKLRESLNTIFSGFRAINSVGIAILKLNLWPPSFIFTWPNAKLFSLRSSCMKNEHKFAFFPAHSACHFEHNNNKRGARRGWGKCFISKNICHAETISTNRSLRATQSEYSPMQRHVRVPLKSPY